MLARSFRSRLIGITGVLAICHGLASGSEDSIPDPAPAVEMEDCIASLDLSSKEACFASLAPDAIAGCEAIHPDRCAPYRQMHLARSALEEAIGALETAANSVYSDYLDNDPSYVDDLVTGIREADQAWRAWRDAECSLSPYLDGMSRREADDLTEVCRVERTRERIDWTHAQTVQLEAREK